mgnify:FL=1
MKPNKTISEFKEFIAKGNVMDMAVEKSLLPW